MAKTADIKRRVGNTPAIGEVPKSSLPFGREPGSWEPGVRPGAGGMGSKPTGGNAGGTRQGNSPAVSVDIDATPGRHTTGHGKVEKTSKNWKTRENGKLNNETT